MMAKTKATPPPSTDETQAKRALRLFLVVFMVINFLLGAITGEGLLIGMGMVAALVAYAIFLRKKQ